MGHHNTLPQPHRNGPKNVFGSERFMSSTSSTNSSHGNSSGAESPSENTPVTEQGRDYGHGLGSGIRSGSKKQTSRRTVSASHISSNSIFVADGTDSASEENKPRSQQGRHSAVKHFRSERDMHSAALLQSMMKDGLDLSIDGTSKEKSINGNEGSVGQYLFGSELSRISFGGGDAKSKAIKMEDIVTESSGVGSGPSDASASTGQTSGTASVSSKQPLEPYMTADSSALPSSAVSARLDASTLAANSHAPGTTITQVSSLASIEQKSSTKPVLSSSTEKPSNPSPPKPPLSPTAIANARMERKHQGPLGHYMPPPEPLAIAPSTLGKSKSPILGSSPLNNQSTFSSYMPNRPSSNHSHPAAPRNSNVPHLEPRSAVADYTPIIHYKRQRSMSLQDADLLTADQFIALMPDDLPPKRRFSSEETLPDNMSHMNPKRKNVPQPDPATTLRSLLSTLRIKCGLVIKHLDTISVPAPKTSTAAASATTDEKTARVSTATAETNSSEQFIGTEDSATEPSTELREDSDKGRSRDMTPTEAFKPKNFVKQLPEAENDAIDLSKDLVESVTLLFNKIDHTMTRMMELLVKYVSTEQFSKLSRELDETCFLAQEVLRAGKCSSPSVEAMGLNQNRQNHEVQQKTLEVSGPEQRHQVQQAEEQHPVAACTLLRLSGEVEISDTRQLSKKESKDRIQQRQNPHKHQYRYRPQSHKPEDAGSPGVLTCQEQQDTVKDYIRTVLSMAEICVAEYMRVYNRMFVIPTTGYRIEGCNDLKKIERALRPEHQHAIDLPIAMPVTGSPQRSLLSRAFAVQATPSDKPGRTVAADTAKATKVSSTTTNISADGQETSRAHLTSLASSKAIAKFEGHTMTRVKSLPESKDEWANLQKRKGMVGSTGVGGAISTGNPATVGTGSDVGGIRSTQVGAGAISKADMSMLGEYSREHMGHEAYYYRNWFLGKGMR
ncbi:hypothetical protein BGZ58_004710 [Dissophora ornata]|nr:hypothetical protein BGZ58_004710 [Dissophora ornata]